MHYPEGNAHIIHFDAQRNMEISVGFFEGLAHLPERVLACICTDMHRGGMGVDLDLDAAILRLLEANEIADQAVLQRLLMAEGHAPSQSTLSRHLKRLSIQKVGGRYQRVEPGAAEPAQAVDVLEAPPNLLVLKTAPGYAQVVAVMLDRAPDITGLAGTVAGDDTVFIAVRDPSMLAEVRAQVERLLREPA
jgi:transcriptional regulator of arginine metabolism